MAWREYIPDYSGDVTRIVLDPREEMPRVFVEVVGGLVLDFGAMPLQALVDGLTGYLQDESFDAAWVTFMSQHPVVETYAELPGYLYADNETLVRSVT